ncbi:uncharacterized protein L203_104077 [Cryptococcus depauperatus CBS 7841]|uniref:Uncharacterized protein n=1 Tax=Cryptococcus depauperatus CBS 7841 TaxID=1295531 RepID=A0A1E3IBJ0_9TREE|nr:hypothetical protein L203_04474 [Cryptococcus depauperatus CBS 7841]
MAVIPLITIGLKGFAWGWSLATLVVASCFVAEPNDYYGHTIVHGTGLSAANAIIAASALTWLYFTAVLIVTFLRPQHIFISVMLDTVFLGFLFVFFLGSVASLSNLVSVIQMYDGTNWASLGNAVLGLAWTMTVWLLGLLSFEVIYTLIRFGGSYPTWRTPFNQLITYGAPGLGAADTHTAGGSMGTVSGAAPATTAKVNEHNYEQAPPQPTQTAASEVTPFPAAQPAAPAQAPVATPAGDKAINQV